MMTPYEKRLEQDLAEARATIQAQMAEAGRLDEVIDELSADRDALESANAMLAADLGAAGRERDAAHAGAERLRAELFLARGAVQAFRSAFEHAEGRNAAARADIKQLTDWIIEADAAYNTDGKPAASLDDCIGLVRMCHEGAAALHEVERQRAALAEAHALLSEASPVNDRPLKGAA